MTPTLQESRKNGIIKPTKLQKGHKITIEAILTQINSSLKKNIVLVVETDYNKELFVQMWFINSRLNVINGTAIIVFFWSTV